MHLLKRLSVLNLKLDVLRHDSLRLSRNNFDLLRLVFALTVCLVHACQLSGFQQLGWIPGILSSAVAVKAFFVVSGFLIFMSYERSSSWRSYTGKRIRRIYPAYSAVVVLCAFGLAAVSSQDIGGYFLSTAWIKYVAANLVFLNFLQPALPGVFEANNMSAVNGALWTLKIEVMFYASVPVLVYLFRRFSHLPVIVFMYLASVTYAGVFSYMAEHTGSAMYAELARQLPGQLSYFMAGALLYYYLPLFERRIAYFLVAAVAVLSLGAIYPMPLLEPFALGVCVVFFALYLYLGNFGKYGDFSYGVYILHFPIIQLLIDSNRFDDAPGYFLMAAVLLTMIGAIFMWHFIEKRFLLRNSHYVAATTVAPQNLRQGAGVGLPGK